MYALHVVVCVRLCSCCERAVQRLAGWLAAGSPPHRAGRAQPSPAHAAGSPLTPAARGRAAAHPSHAPYCTHTVPLNTQHTTQTSLFSTRLRVCECASLCPTPPRAARHLPHPYCSHRSTSYPPTYTPHKHHHSTHHTGSTCWRMRYSLLHHPSVPLVWIMLGFVSSSTAQARSSSSTQYFEFTAAVPGGAAAVICRAEHREWSGQCSAAIK